MKALSGVEREWSGARPVPPPTAPSTGRPLLAAGGRIGAVVSKRPTGDSCADKRPHVPSGPRHCDSSAEPDGNNLTTTPGGWLLKITVSSPPAVAHWENQWQLLGPLMSFDPASCTWSTVLGAFDPAALSVLESCFTAARDYRADVHMEAVPAPDQWLGPVFVRPPNGTAP